MEFGGELRSSDFKFRTPIRTNLENVLLRFWTVLRRPIERSETFVPQNLVTRTYTGKTKMTSSETELRDDYACPAIEEILRRFHRSVHLHYESYANISMDSLKSANFCLDSVGNTLLAGKNSSAGLQCHAQSCV
jgi:hypothetical protein